jgi:hypothetical protein
MPWWTAQSISERRTPMSLSSRSLNASSSGDGAGAGAGHNRHAIAAAISVADLALHDLLIQPSAMWWLAKPEDGGYWRFQMGGMGFV